MAEPIEFYFDLSSPYGYFASTQIEALAAKHGREALWRPYLMGAALKAMNAPPNVEYPIKGDYVRRDFERTARWFGVPYRTPQPFPVATVAACRAFYWVDAQDPKRAKEIAMALYTAYFVEGIDISAAENVVRVCAEAGIDADAARAGMSEPAVKERLKAVTDDALARGIFGSPFFVVDGEAFWGTDRLPHVERWLAEGGF
ncbi:MAG: 2-hydroxychromene-2-carboxylate isomerase [Burkholderiales bacterium]|nr:2-hydroxychromene-2-carboxylate isomerase [Burkholderiales bacterium]